MGIADLPGIDTIVVATKKDSFEKIFLNTHRWHAIRISDKMKPKIKYIAAYRALPVAAITHIAKVKKILLWEFSGKYELIFKEPATAIGPIRFDVTGKTKAPQSPRYTKKSLLMKSKTLDDVFNLDP